MAIHAPWDMPGAAAFAGIASILMGWAGAAGLGAGEEITGGGGNAAFGGGASVAISDCTWIPAARDGGGASFTGAAPSLIADAWMAAPIAMASSGLTPAAGSRPKCSITRCR